MRGGKKTDKNGHPLFFPLSRTCNLAKFLKKKKKKKSDLHKNAVI